MSATARFQLPFIMPGQAQKELHHNEALTRIDMTLHACVEEGPLTTPPQGAKIGQSWIVAVGADGDWAGKDHQLAAWTEGGWRFVTPTPGLAAWSKQHGCWLHWNGAAWSSGELPVASIVIQGQQILGNRKPAVATPSGGTVIDIEARSAINAIIATLMSHGLTD